MSLRNFFENKESSPFTGRHGDAHFAAPDEVQASGLFGNKGIRLGYYRDPASRKKDWGRVIRYSGDAHLITVAPTGSGKGRDVLVGALLDYEGSCIVIDPKGQLAAITRAHRERLGKVIVLNPLRNELPFDLGPSANYNPMAHLDPSSDSFGPDCEAIADSIVVRDETNSHFSDSAQILITGLMMHLAAHRPTEDRNLFALAQIIADDDALHAVVAQALRKDQEGFISGKLARFAKVTGEDRELRSIISTAITQCGFINNKAIGRSLSSSDFSFRDLKGELTTVYLVLPAKFIEPCGKWFRLVLASAIAELWSEERGKYAILAIMDEFAQLGRLAVIADAMGMARGFGLQLWPILQDLTQLKEHYGDRWESFLGGAAVRQFFAPREHFTAEYVSKMCGVKTAVTQGQSVQHAQHIFHSDSAGSSWGQQMQPLLHPHNVLGLGLQETIIIGPQNIVIDALRKPYLDIAEFQNLYNLDPYHKVSGPTQTVPSKQHGPPSTFADREEGAARAAARNLRRPRSLSIRLLMWGASPNPIINVARKVEYVLTLPFRVLGAIVTAPLALHNKPIGTIIAFLAIFGFWEIFNTLAKDPLIKLHDQKTHEYQAEMVVKEGGKDNTQTAGEAFYSNYMATKFVIAAYLRALKAGVKDDGTKSADETNLDYFMRKMSRSLDQEMNESSWQEFENNGAWIANRPRRIIHTKPRTGPIVLDDASAMAHDQSYGK